MGEVWIGVCLAVVIDLVPIDVTSAAVALFLFIINNIGSCMTLLVPVMAAQMGLRYTLLVLFPGSYIVAAILFGVTLAVQVCKERRWRACYSCCPRKGTELSGVLREDSPLIQAGEGGNNSSSSSSSEGEEEEGEISIMLPEFKKKKGHRAKARARSARSQLTESYDIYTM